MKILRFRHRHGIVEYPIYGDANASILQVITLECPLEVAMLEQAVKAIKEEIKAGYYQYTLESNTRCKEIEQ